MKLLILTIVLLLQIFQDVLSQGIMFGKDSAFNSILKTKLQMVSNIPFDEGQQAFKDCGDTSIWKIVSQGKRSIEPLITQLSDTSFTNVVIKIRTGHKSQKLRIGDIAFVTLNQIIHLPLFELAGQFDVIDCGWYSFGFFSFLNKYSNRLKFQEKVMKWYQINSFAWTEFKNNEVIYNCQRTHNIHGYFKAN